MDNLTHALVGLALADAAALALPRPPSPRVRGLLRIASAVGNNLPDLDFLYSRITPGKLGYLLHHRGHTHTLLAGTVLGALTLALLLSVARRRALALSLEETRWLAVLSVLGPWAHVGMDALNNYGVHPFWPVYDGWLYGDVVFIVEPWFWVFTIPPVLFASSTVVGRVVLGLCLALALVAAWLMRMMEWGTALALTLASALAVLAAFRLRARGRVCVALGGCLAVVLTFGAASRLARASLLEAVEQRRAPNGAPVTVVDAVLTPGPANPVCWQAVVVGRSGTDYVLEAAKISIAPSLVPSFGCRLERTGLSLGMRSSGRFTRSFVFQGEYLAPLAELRALAVRSCHAAAFLRFARAPFWLDRGATLYLGDLRYDRSADQGFAELEVPAGPRDCPRWLPPWTPPTKALLE